MLEINKAEFAKSILKDDFCDYADEVMVWKGEPWNSGAVSYFKGGSKIKTRTFWKNNKQHGPLLGYAKNGTLIKKFFYVNGVLEGPGKEWWKNGNKHREFQFLHGVTVGEVKVYSKDGSLDYIRDMKGGSGVRMRFYEDGKIIKEYCSDEKGTVKEIEHDTPNSDQS